MNRSIYLCFIFALIISISCEIEIETVSSESSFWDRFDELYGGKVNEQREKYLEEYRERDITGIIPEDDDVFINELLSGLNIIGSGIHWWNGKQFSPVIEMNYKLKNKYVFQNLNKSYSVPDEIFIVDTPLVEEKAETTVQQNLNEYMGATQKSYGFGIGYAGVISLGGSVRLGKGRSIFRSESIRTTMSDLRATYFTMNMIPPQYLTLKKEFVEIFTSLPRFDETTKTLWFKQLDKVGTHMVYSAILGGTLHMEEEIDIINMGDKKRDWISTQANLVFLSLTAPTKEKRLEYERMIDSDFKKYEKHEIEYQGGDTSLPIEESKSWLSTLPRNLTHLRLRTIPYSELFPQSQVREDLDNAINEYLAQFAALNINPLLGPEEQVGQSSNGASISVSSIYTPCHKKCSSVCCKYLWCKPKNVCTPQPTQHTLISPGGNGEFIFGQGDGAQRATVTLNAAYYLTKAIARVSGPGSGSPVTLAKLTAGDVWKQIYGQGHLTFPPDGACQFKRDRYPILTNSLTYEFGPAPPGIASKIYKLETYAIRSSTPGGHVDSVKRNVVEGWTFDPIDPTKSLEVEIYANGNKIASGMTNIERPDVVKNYELPPNARPGFSIPISLPESPEQRFEVYAVFKGVTQQGRSQTAKLWNSQPAGKIIRAEPSYVEGWAYHPHFPANEYTVNVKVDGVVVGSTKTNINSKVVREIYGVEGNYGWKVPVKVRTAGHHIVTASVVLPNGKETELPDQMIIDLRYPKGLIFNVTPSYVTGFAYDPSHPDDSANVQVYIDDQLVANKSTNILIPELNEMYAIQGQHGFNVSYRMQGGKIHLVSVYVFVNGTVRSLIETRSIAVGLDDGGDNRLTTGIINYAGVGYDPCSGEWRLRVVDLNYKQGKKLNDSYWEPSKLRGLPVPDEIEFERHAKTTYQNTTRIFNNTRDWAKYESHSWKAGLNLGLIGFGKSYRKDTFQSVFENKMGRLGWSERKIEFFRATLLPPELLRFAPYAGDTFRKLPPYTPTTRPQYFRAFDMFGITYAKVLHLGGKMELEASYITKSESSQRYEFENSQFSFIFTYMVSFSFSHEKSKAEANIDKAFMESTKRSIRLVGGTPETFSPEESVEWTKSIIKNPGVIDMDLETITVLFDPIKEGERKKWVDSAISDYMHACTPERWICDPINVATVRDSARILHPSSIHPKGGEISMNNLLLDPKDQKPWGDDGEKGFLFADGDSNQNFIVELYDVMKLKKISVDVDIHPSERSVWQYIKVDVSKDMKNWSFWGMVGDKNDQVNVRYEHYDFNILSPEPVKYIRFSFGEQRRDTKKGSRIKRVYAYNCV